MGEGRSAEFECEMRVGEAKLFSSRFLLIFSVFSFFHSELSPFLLFRPIPQSTFHPNQK